MWPGVQNYINVMLHRNNTLVPGGLLYKDDPTVLAWELQNEPQLREGFELCAAPRPAQDACTALHALHLEVVGGIMRAASRPICYAGLVARHKTCKARAITALEMKPACASRAEHCLQPFPLQNPKGHSRPLASAGVTHAVDRPVHAAGGWARRWPGRSCIGTCGASHAVNQPVHAAGGWAHLWPGRSSMGICGVTHAVD